MLIHTVIFIVSTLIYAAANTVQHGVHFIDSQIFENPHPLQVNEIESNRHRRNAFDIPNFSETTVDTAGKIRRNVFQNVLSALPNMDIIKDLLPFPRTKRSFYDYDTSENQENIDPKRQLEQIASRNFAPDVRNEDQRIKTFFSRIFSMIDSNKNCSNSEIHYNGRGHDNDLTVADATLVDERYNSRDYLDDTDDQSSEFIQLDVKELLSDRSETHKTGKYSNLNDFELEKNTYVPLRKVKKRRDIQNYSFPQNSMNVKINSRPKRQLEESNYEDSIRKQFNKQSNLEGLVMEKNPYGLVRNLKKRQEAQDDSLPLNNKNGQDDSFPLNGVNDRVSPRSERQLSKLINDDSNRKQFNKHSNSEDLLSEKSPNVPIRRLKKRQKGQDDSFPSNYENAQDDSRPLDGMTVKNNLRPERQLGELRNDDSTHKKFYVYSEVDSRAIDEYENLEPPMEQQLPYGPIEDDMVQSSPADISLPTTIEVSIANHESNEEIDNNSNSVNLESSPTPSTITSQSSRSYPTPTDIDEIEENRMISPEYNMNSPKSSDFYQRTTETVLPFKMNTTEQTPTSPSSNTPSVQNNNMVTNFNRKSKVINKLRKATTTYVPTVNVPDDNTAGHYQSSKHLHQDQNNSEKISSRRANIHSEKENVERKQTADTSMIKKDGASLKSDIKIAKASDEADTTTNKNDILVNPLSARIKLDLFIHLQPSGNDGYYNI